MYGSRAKCENPLIVLASDWPIILFEGVVRMCKDRSNIYTPFGREDFERKKRQGKEIGRK